VSSQRFIVALLALAALPLVAAGEDIRDPMRPPASAVAAPATAMHWTLHSTAVSGGQRSAVVNGQVVAVGDAVQGARVLDIRQSSVRLATAQGEITLRLPVYEIKKGAR